MRTEYSRLWSMNIDYRKTVYVIIVGHTCIV